MTFNGATKPGRTSKTQDDADAAHMQAALKTAEASVNQPAADPPASASESAAEQQDAPLANGNGTDVVPAELTEQDLPALAARAHKGWGILKSAVKNLDAAHNELAEGAMMLANALAPARIITGSDIAYHHWLEENGLGKDNLDSKERSILTRAGYFPEVSRRVFEKTHRRSIQTIWDNELEPAIADAINSGEVCPLGIAPGGSVTITEPTKRPPKTVGRHKNRKAKKKAKGNGAEKSVKPSAAPPTSQSTSKESSKEVPRADGDEAQTEPEPPPPSADDNKQPPEQPAPAEPTAPPINRRAIAHLIDLYNAMQPQDQEAFANDIVGHRVHLEWMSRKQKFDALFGGDIEEAREVMKARQGVFTKAEYNDLLMGVHPDRQPDAEEKNALTRLLTDKKRLLLREADAPTSPDLERRFAEGKAKWDAKEAQEQAAHEKRTKKFKEEFYGK